MLVCTGDMDKRVEDTAPLYAVRLPVRCSAEPLLGGNMSGFHRRGEAPQDAYMEAADRPTRPSAGSTTEILIAMKTNDQKEGYKQTVSQQNITNRDIDDFGCFG